MYICVYIYYYQRHHTVVIVHAYVFYLIWNPCLYCLVGQVSAKHWLVSSPEAMYVVCNYVHSMHITMMWGQSVSWASVNTTLHPCRLWCGQMCLAKQTGYISKSVCPQGTHSVCGTSISSHYFDVGIKYTLMYTFPREVIDKSFSIILLCTSPFVVCLLSPPPLLSRSHALYPQAQAFSPNRERLSLKHPG